MIFLGHAVKVGFVCLTAVTMLAASLPHFDCVCPNGTHKSFCLGVPSHGTGCCCGGSRCSSSSGGKCCWQTQDSSADTQAKQLCCYESQRNPSNVTPGTGLQVSNNCCQKTAVSAEFVGVSPTSGAAKQNLTDGLSVPLPQLVSAVAEQMAGQWAFSGHGCALPPPADLVITLQHFLI